MRLFFEPGAYLAAGIEIGNFQIRFYALCILFGMMIAVILGLREAKKLSINPDDILNGGVIGIILGIIGARIYYIIFAANEFSSPAEWFAIWNGGLAIHGGIIVAFVFALIYCKKKKINYLMVFDMVAIGLLIGQTCGRWGNFFNQEAHGGETTRAFLESLRLPTFIVNQMEIGGTYYHPTFLYESLWNFVAIIVLLILRRTRTIRLGDQACIYLIWYGIGRFFIEGMRTDSLMIGSIKQNQLISIVLIVVGLAFLLFKYIKLKPGYYVDYLEPEVEPTIGKDVVAKLNASKKKTIFDKLFQNKKPSNKTVVKKEKLQENEEFFKEEKIVEEEKIEVPEELDKNAPFRKSKYIVDDDDEE